MLALEKTLRNKLERTVMEARDVAEAAARAAVEQLGVGEPKAYAHLSDDEKELRRKLRVHGRQLGDLLHSKQDTQELDRLVEEIAYEHWHRMLFARCLAENQLLMYWPDGDNDPIDVNLETCQGLLDDGEEKAGSVWELAARFASRMLPQIFRPDSPVFQLTLPPEHQQKLERFLSDLPREVFHASDSLGWVYQFWQANNKKRINESEVKIGARELPAVTQLFTEQYMVAFLLDNSLGAWWVGELSGVRHEFSEELRPGAIEKLRTAKTENELREFFSLPGVPLEYLRFVQVPTDDSAGAWKLETEHSIRWRPASGWFDGWPQKLAELKMLDPCCGSGHFLVAAFLMLVPMRMEREGLSAREAVDRVLAENIHGLEIDQRCVELAAFSLALSAWKYPQAGRYRALPELSVACAGLSIASTKEQWMAILEGQSLKLDLRFYFGQLYDLFSKAPTLGSLINPHRFLGSGLLDECGMEALLQVLRDAIKSESPASERHELGVVAAGLAKAAELLAERYTLVATNVPYLGRGKQDDILKEHIETQYPLGRADLATAFVLRCLEFCAKGGATALVTPQNWLFLTTYKKLRETLLHNRTWNAVVRLGEHAFESTAAAGAFGALTVIAASQPDEEQRMAGIDVSAPRGQRPIYAEEKAAMLRGEQPSEIVVLPQKEQLKNPDARITLQEAEGLELLSKYAQGLQGVSPADAPHYGRKFWELPVVAGDWRFWQSTVDRTCYYGGKELVLWYGRDLEEAIAGGNAYLRGAEAWGSTGVLVRQVGHLPCAIYSGEMFDTNCAVIVPRRPDQIAPVWCFCSSPGYREAVRTIDPKLNVTNATLVKVPFDLAHWQKVAAEKYPNGLPEPESDDPTQWLFHGRPEASTAPLQVAVARLLGYRWPAESDDKMRLSERARELVKRCDELLPLADKDGIVCLPPVRGEASAADRLLNLLAAAYGRAWSPGVLNRLLMEAGFEGKTLETWLRDGFFAQHCELFQQRPFVWHIWDGLRDGFAALVNYHRLDRKNLETLIYTYLGDWIKRQKDDIASRVDGAQERLAAAETLKKRLELILAGEAPYDIFVRWKPIAKQPIGWEPDINDGVRLNIRPFMSVPDIRKKGAGVLREKPNIKWTKDRGKDVRSAPWYGLFKGERINDHHLTLAEKRAVREE